MKIDENQPYRVNKVKGLILADMRAGIVSWMAKSFSELHDYVDANEYLLEVWPEWDPAADCEAENALMDSITAWLACGEAAKEMPDGYIWLEDDESHSSAECGCLLIAQHKGSGPAIILCPLHSAASAMVEALQEIQRNCELWKKADTMAGRLYGIAETAIAKAKPGRG